MVGVSQARFARSHPYPLPQAGGGLAGRKSCSSCFFWQADLRRMAKHWRLNIWRKRLVRSLNPRNLSELTKKLAEKKLRKSDQCGSSDVNDAEYRVFQISEAFRANQHIYELRRHTVVALIACLQTYHRGYLSNIMEADPELRIRGASLVGEKFPLSEILKITGGQEITVSEIIAHAAPVNSVGDMISWLSGIFNQDFKGLLVDAVSPFDRHETDDQIKIVSNVENMLSSISKAFDIRHILAHEAALDFEIESGTVIEIIESIELWMRAAYGVLWQTVLRNEPFTQFEINEAASRDYQNASDRMECALARVRDLLGDNKRAKFEDNHQKWLINAIEFNDLMYASEQGTMWPGVRASELARNFNDRAKQIEDWVYYLEL